MIAKTEYPIRLSGLQKLIVIIGILYFPAIVFLTDIEPFFILFLPLIFLPFLFLNKKLLILVFASAFVYARPLISANVDIRIDDFVFIVLSAIWIFDKLLLAPFPKNNTGIKKLLVIWFIVNSLSVIMAFPEISRHQFFQSMYYLTSLGQYIFLFFIISDFTNKYNMKEKLLNIICGISLIISIAGIVQVHVLGLEIATGTLSYNHFHLGIYICLTFFVLAGYMSGSRNLLTRSFILLTMVLMVYALYLSASRAGIIAFGAGLMAFLFFSGKKPAYLLIVLIFLVILFFGADFINSLPEQSLETTRFTNLESDISLLGRFYIWLGSYNLILSEPRILLTGAGLGAFQTRITPYLPLLPGGANGAHNNYLHVLIETGIAGLVIFLTVVLYLVKRSLKLSKTGHIQDRRIYYGYFCGLIALLISGFTQETLSVQEAAFNFLGYFFLITAIVFSPFNISRQNNE